MKSLSYLILTQLKNRFRELLRKPAKLVLYLVALAAVTGIIILTVVYQATGATAPLFLFKGIYFAFLVMFLILWIQKGLISGDAIFEMNDVNFLFVSPLNPRIILMYGLVRLAKVAFFSGFFILFQGQTLSRFGVDFSGVLLVFATFFLNTIALSLLSLVIYSATNANPRRKIIVRVIALLVFVPALAAFAFHYWATLDPLFALAQTTASPLFNLIPFAGWTSAGTIALLEGNLIGGLGWLSLLLIATLGMITYIMLSRADYYEDVLVATETAFEKKRAIAEGNLQSATATNGKVKVTKTGISGSGALTIFYKHLRETFRQNRFGFLSLSGGVIFLCILAAAILLPRTIGILLVLQILMWMQIFFIATGRGLKELFVHYIYLIPESAVAKLVASNLEVVLKTLVEGVFFFGIPGLILKENPLIILGAIVTYALFSLLLLGINYVSMRFSGANMSQGILLLLYLVAVILIMLPGLIPALVVGFWLGGTMGMLLALLILSAWELVAALICFALSRNMLHRCDMPSMKV